MIECPHCEKCHKTDALIEKCGVLKARREAREEARQQDLDARLAHAKAYPLERFLVDWMADHTRRYKGELMTASFSTVVPAVKKAYPAPKDWPHRCREKNCFLEGRKGWDLASLIYVNCWRLDWTFAEVAA